MTASSTLLKINLLGGELLICYSAEYIGIFYREKPTDSTGHLTPGTKYRLGGVDKIHKRILKSCTF